jgi:hypothetical protein
MIDDDKKIDSDAAADDIRDEKRKRLLARVAGYVAASVVAAPSKKSTSPAAIAEISVDIAEAILARVGL